MSTFKKIIIPALFLLHFLSAELKWESNTLYLSPQGFVDAVMQNQTEISKLETQVAQALASFKQQKEDMVSPYINADYSKLESESSANVDESESFGVGLSQFVPVTGSALSLGLASDYAKLPASLGGSETWTSKLDIGLRQSLLRGGPFAAISKYQLDLSADSVQLQKIIYNQALSGTLLGSLTLLWNYQLTLDGLNLDEESIADSQNLLSLNRRRQGLGTVDITQIYISEASLAQNENALQNTEKNLMAIKEKILSYIGAEDKDASEVNIVLTEPFEFRELNIDDQAVYKEAIDNRFDLALAKKQVEMAELGLKIAKKAMLPRLDATVSYSLAQKEASDDLGASYDGLGDLNDIYYGLEFEAPVKPSAYKVVTEKAEADLKNANENLDIVKRDLQFELNDQLRNLRLLQDQVQRNQRVVGLMEQNVTELRKDYNNGKVDTQVYVDALNLRRTWEKIYQSSLFQYELAKAQLQITTGRFLEQYKVQEDDFTEKVK